MLLSGATQAFIPPPLIRANIPSYKSAQKYLSFANKFLPILHLNSTLISQRAAAPTNLVESPADDT